MIMDNFDIEVLFKKLMVGVSGTEIMVASCGTELCS